MDLYKEDYIDYSDDEDDIGLMYGSSYLLSSDSEKDDLDESIFNSKATLAESEDDDFEKDMADELSMTMSSLVAPIIQSTSKSNKTASNKKVTFAEKDEEKKDFYDDVYFDSDSSMEEADQPKRIKKNQTKHRILSNDELFYDPDIDDEDQAWVDSKRRSYQVKRKKKANTPSTKRQQSNDLPQTDAVLNCPACLTTLCRDCQRHEIYQNQYRAMFVFHCKIDFTERLRFPKKDKKSFMKKKKLEKQKKKQMMKEKEHSEMNTSTNTAEKSCQDELLNQENNSTMEVAEELNSNISNNSNVNEKPDNTLDKETGISNLDTDSKFMDMESEKISEDQVNSNTDEDNEFFNPVSCDVCNTKVAVYDKDEVYHFFNIITSY